MRRVALTGGIATGKSTVLRRLRDCGLPVIDADVVARDVVRAGTPASAAIRQRFGDAVFLPDGSVDRKALGAVVFSDPEARRALERIVHPAVYEAIADWFETVADAPAAVADIPLLFETGREGEFDLVVVTACAPELQVSRIRARDGLSEAEARQRLAAQSPIDEKVRRADRVIRTDGALSETEAQADRLAAELTGS